MLAVAVAAIAITGAVNEVYSWALHRWISEAREWRNVVFELQHLAEVAAALLAVALTPRAGRWAALGVTRLRPVGMLALAVLAPLGYLWLNYLIVDGAGVLLALSRSISGIDPGPLRSGFPANFVYIALIFPACFGEELLWRGLLWRELARHPFRPWAATWITGVCWALWHISADGWVVRSERLVFCLLLSIVLSYLRLTSGSIWPCAVFHALMNVAGIFRPPDLTNGAWLADILVLVLPFAFALFLRVRGIRRMTADCRRGATPTSPVDEPGAAGSS